VTNALNKPLMFPSHSGDPYQRCGRRTPETSSPDRRVAPDVLQSTKATTDSGVAWFGGKRRSSWGLGHK